MAAPCATSGTMASERVPACATSSSFVRASVSASSITTGASVRNACAMAWLAPSEKATSETTSPVQATPSSHAPGSSARSTCTLATFSTRASALAAVDRTPRSFQALRHEAAELVDEPEVVRPAALGLEQARARHLDAELGRDALQETHRLRVPGLVVEVRDRERPEEHVVVRERHHEQVADPHRLERGASRLSDVAHGAGPPRVLLSRAATAMAVGPTRGRTRISRERPRGRSPRRFAWRRCQVVVDQHAG